MIPVRQRKDQFLVILVGKIWIMNDKRSTESVGVLTTIVGVIPICTRLVDL